MDTKTLRDRILKQKEIISNHPGNHDQKVHDPKGGKGGARGTDIVLTVKSSTGKDLSWSKEDIQEMLDDYDTQKGFRMYLNADNLPRYLMEGYMRESGRKNFTPRIQGMAHAALMQIKAGRVKAINFRYGTDGRIFSVGVIPNKS